DAERVGAFALHDPEVTDPEAWAELLQDSQAGPRLEQLASRLASDAEWSLASLERTVRGLAAELAVKPRALMTAARIALTGSRVSPGLFEVIWLIGRERAVTRLRDAAARWSAAAVGNRH